MPTFYKHSRFPLTEVFIETGTNKGDSFAAAVGAGYPRCLSVEFVEALYLLARERFKDQTRVTLFRGSSPDTLPAMIDPALSTTFWLDAHHSGSDPSWQDPRYGECPLLQELKVILRTPWATPPLLCIDDAFIFKEATWRGPSHVLEPRLFTKSHWPDLAEIVALLEGYEIWEENYILFAQRA
jgi:hypothetical protein